MTIGDDVAEQRWLVQRPRLIDRLEGAAIRNVVLVAPAGYGKSTLVRQFLRSRGREVVWYHCTQGSADVATLAIELADAFNGAAPIALEAAERHLRAALNPQQESALIADIFNEALRESRGELCLVVDDYERVAGEFAAEDFLGRVILGGNVRAIVASRVRPAWATARRLTYGELVEIDARELAMTSDEAEAVFQSIGRSPNPELLALADGWPAAITLAALGGPDVTAVSGALEDFIASEVCRPLDAGARADLSILAGLSTITLQVARIVLGDEDARRALSRARELGVLERITADRFELHPLVRDLLRREPLAAHHRRRALAAGDDLAEAGCWDDLFNLADRLQSESLLDLLLTRGVRLALDEGRVSSVRRWLDFARLHGMSRPLVRLGEAELALRDGYYIQSETLGAEVASTLEEHGAARTWALFIAGRAAHLSGREQQAVEYYRLARLAADNDSDRREADWGELKGAIDLELPEAATLLQRLRESERATAVDRVEVASRSLMLGARLGSLAALDEARDALQLVPLIPDPVARASFLNTYAYACAIAGEYEDALGALDELEAEAEAQRLRFALPYVTCARAVVHAARREFDAAFAQLSSASIEARRIADSHVLGMCASIRSRALIALGRFAEAASAASYQHPALIKSMHGELVATKALALVCDGDEGSARRLSDDAVGLTSAVEVLGIAHCVDAIANARRNATEADASCRSAAQYARDSRYVDGLIAAYRGYPELARRIAAIGDHVDWFRVVMKRANDDEIARLTGLKEKADARALSKREAEVFALLREGLSNKEIGTRLFIAEDTAKLHVYRIMKKLGARTRTEAALRTPRSG